MLSSKHNEEERAIYINPNLTKERQFLYKIARDARKNKKLDFVWVKNGEIFIRKNENSKILKLIYKDQLNDF